MDKLGRRERETKVLGAGNYRKQHIKKTEMRKNMVHFMVYL
jgi:hypothetical protein